MSAEEFEPLEEAVRVAYSLFQNGVFDPFSASPGPTEKKWETVLVIARVKSLQALLEAYDGNPDEEPVKQALDALEQLSISAAVLKETKVGRYMVKRMKSVTSGPIKTQINRLVSKWKDAVKNVKSTTPPRVKQESCRVAQAPVSQEARAMHREFQNDLSDSDDDDRSVADLAKEDKQRKLTAAAAELLHLIPDLDVQLSKPVRESSPKLDSIRARLHSMADEDDAERERKRIRVTEISDTKKGRGGRSLVAVGGEKQRPRGHPPRSPPMGSSAHSGAHDRRKDLPEPMRRGISSDLRDRTRKLLRESIEAGTYSSGKRDNTRAVVSDIEAEMYRGHSSSDKEYKTKGMMLSANLKRAGMLCLKLLDEELTAEDLCNMGKDELKSYTS